MKYIFSLLGKINQYTKEDLSPSFDALISSAGGKNCVLSLLVSPCLAQVPALGGT
jgi:hypothetical protein